MLALRFLPATLAGARGPSTSPAVPAKDDDRPPPPNLRRAAAAGWLVLALVHLGSILPSPIGPGRAIDPSFTGSPRAGALERAIGLVPDDASISAQDDIVPHVAARSEVHRWPDGIDTDDYVLLDAEGAAANVRNHGSLASAARALRADPAFTVLLDEAGVILARRIPH